MSQPRPGPLAIACCAAGWDRIADIDNAAGACSLHVIQSFQGQDLSVNINFSATEPILLCNIKAVFFGILFSAQVLLGLAGHNNLQLNSCSKECDKLLPAYCKG